MSWHLATTLRRLIRLIHKGSYSLLALRIMKIRRQRRRSIAMEVTCLSDWSTTVILWIIIVTLLKSMMMETSMSQARHLAADHPSQCENRLRVWSMTRRHSSPSTSSSPTWCHSTPRNIRYRIWTSRVGQILSKKACKARRANLQVPPPSELVAMALHPASPDLAGALPRSIKAFVVALAAYHVSLPGQAVELAVLNLRTFQDQTATLSQVWASMMANNLI